MSTTGTQDQDPDNVCGKLNTVGSQLALYTGTVIRLGYPTQNLTIPASTNRSLRLANVKDADRVRGLVRENVADLKTILRWNAEHGVGLFRMGQNLIPFASHPAFPYDWEVEHGEDLRAAGELARDLGVELSMHPGRYINPGSPKPEVVGRSLTELRYVARVFDLLGNPDGVAVLQDPVKQPGAHSYSVDSRDWQTLLGALDGREADVMVEAKGKEHALAPLGVEIG